MSSDIERKRPNSKSVELICISEDDDDEIESKKRREASSNQNVPISSVLSNEQSFSIHSINEEFIKEIHRITSLWNSRILESSETSSTRRQYPEFETVPTPTLVLDCCEP
jgi:hypothetical protein